MKDKAEKTLTWVVVISTILFVFIVCTFLIKIFIGEKYLEAFIGFGGSILGGSLTLIGVIWTINRQKKVDRLNKLPSDIINLWKIQKYFIFPLTLINGLPEDPYKKDEEVIDEFYNANAEYVTELSAHVSSQVYSLVNSYFTHIYDYSSYKRRNENKIWFEKVFEYQREIREIIDSFEKEYEKLK